MNTNHPYRHKTAARAVIAALGGRICDLPGYTLDGLARSLEHARHMRRTYDAAHGRARRAGTLGLKPLEVPR